MFRSMVSSVLTLGLSVEVNKGYFGFTTSNKPNVEKVSCNRR